VAIVRLFASAREAAGTDRAELPGSTVREVLDAARTSFGPTFEAVLQVSNVWVNGDPVDLDTAVTDTDEVAVLPPVSGGA
jgi:sulfur-carrier protein